MSTTRTRILEQALALLNAQGYQSVTTRQVAQAVGMGITAYAAAVALFTLMALWRR